MPLAYWIRGSIAISSYAGPTTCQAKPTLLNTAGTLPDDSHTGSVVHDLLWALDPLVCKHRVRDERIRREPALLRRALRIWQGLEYGARRLAAF